MSDNNEKDNMGEYLENNNTDNIKIIGEDIDKKTDVESNFASLDSTRSVGATKLPSAKILPDIMDSPFLILENVNEDVNVVTGELSYTTTDIHLPGKNWMDLIIQRKYSSQASNNNNLFSQAKRDIKMYSWRVVYRNDSDIYAESAGYYTDKGKCGEDANIEVEYWRSVAPSYHDKGKYLRSVSTRKSTDYKTGIEENKFSGDYCGLGMGGDLIFHL